MRAVPIPRGWGFDLSSKLYLPGARSLLLAPYPGNPRVALNRYVSLGNPSPGDITVAERDAIFTAGWPALVLVQHVEYPHWNASNIVGTEHGSAAKRHANLVEYPDACHLVLDMEGLGNAGSVAYDYIAYWTDAVRPHPTIVYDGYADGLADPWKLQLVARGCVAANGWWSDFGPRSLPDGLSWAAKQHDQTVVGGETVDPDQYLIDGAVVGMSLDAAA